MAVEETVHSDLNFREGLEADKPFEYDLGGGMYIVVGGVRTGFYRMVADKSKDAEEGAQVPKRIAAFVPWNAATHEAARVTKDGVVRTTSATHFYPEVITPHGRFRTQFPVDEVTAYDVRKLRAKLHRAGIAIPSDTKDRTELENLLSTLGVHDGSREQHVAYEAMGWAHIGGEWTYVAPAGAITSTGIVKTTVTSPGNEDDDPDALPPALGEIGFDRTLDTKQLRKAAGAFSAFVDLMPDGHSAPYLTLGVVFTSVLAHEKQCVLNLVGRTGSGKTNVAKIALGYFSTARKVTADLTSKPSLIGLQARAVWSRFSLCLWDDYRAEDSRTDTDMKKNASSLIQMHLTADDSPKSNRARGIARGNPVRSFGILTSEQIVDGGEGVANRLIVSKVAKGDVKLTPRGKAPYDEYIRTYERTGLVRGLMATYLQWIAQKIEGTGGLRAFEDEVKDRSEALLGAIENSRTLTSAAAILTGWDYMFEFAKEHGFDDLLPEWDDIEAAMLAGANDADLAASAANPAVRLIERTRDKIAAGGGYVSLEYGDSPDAWKVLGWENDHNFIKPRARAQVGKITPDEEWIVLNGNWIADLAREMGITTDSKALNDLFVELPSVSAKSAQPRPSGFGFNGRPRGIYIKAAELVPALLDPDSSDKTTRATTRRS